MRRSTDRILTSHAGSLVRPPDLLELMQDKVNGRPYDEAAWAARTKSAVAEIVKEQANAGVDIPSDGELSKPMFSDYVADRLSGFEGENTGPGFVNPSRRPDPFPEYSKDRPRMLIGLKERRPMNVGPLGWKDRAYIQDIANMKAAMAVAGVEEAFLPSPSPGIVAMRIPSDYYKTEEEYDFALADVLKDEYRAIVDAGLLLQIDAPDAAMSWDRQNWKDLPEFRKALQVRHAALNHALQGIPSDRVRYHVCWGNNENPHTGDIEFKEIVDLILEVNADLYSIEAANPRHAHEWKVWQDLRLPEGKILMPGVIDSLTTFVEHPEVVAQRIVQYAGVVGRENVIAGVDCGFGTGASATPRVHPELVMAKFRSLSEGARIASRELW
ncbi:MAG TPA: cobalamin-independent methionine synthase II family protein [Dehalococcoidia bacterium]|nr:cobalamin-independent methionine synthase II family protein [Dehalococcoidia bacterium]